MQKIRRKLWVIFGLIALGLLVFPINNLFLRIGTILVVLGTYALALYSARKSKILLTGLISIGFLVGIFLSIPGTNPDTSQLRNSYINSLRTYEGTRYVWGGENRLGIDCSGLVRAGLIKANFEQGLLTANPRLLRHAFSLWWHDCSAKALGEEYRGLTRHITQVSGINSMDQTQLSPGDMAVTTSGIHVLAYLGNEQWIEADPTLNKVVIVKVPSKNNPWLDEPVKIMRWTELETK